MTWAWEAAKEKEDESYPSHLMSESVDDDNQTGLPTPSVTPIGHNPVVTNDDNLPHPTHDSLPAHLSKYESKWSPEITLTTSRSRDAAWPDKSGSSTPTPTPLPTEDYPPPSATGANGHSNYPHDKSESKHRPPIAVAAILPILVLAIIGAFVFFCVRKRRKQKQIATAQAKVQEMKSRSPNTTQAYLASPLPPARPLSRPTPTNLSPTTPTSPQPVILGPISGSNNNYFTGIDTSDILSVRSNERTGLGDPFADGNSLNEEPPPPYYPRSIAPLSRDTSLRVPQSPPAPLSQSELIGVRGQPVRSPFDDPRADDAVSDVAGFTWRPSRDDLSAVSDISYQQDPVVGRANV